MHIVKGDRDGQYRCLSPTDMLIGLITKMPGQVGPWKVELFMRIEGTTDTEDEAIAFARGCWATCEAFHIGLVQSMKDKAQAMQVPTVERHTGPKGKA